MLANIPVMVDFGANRPERPMSELVTKKLRPGDSALDVERNGATTDSVLALAGAAATAMKPYEPKTAGCGTCRTTRDFLSKPLMR
jgi:hypothetical protein